MASAGNPADLQLLRKSLLNEVIEFLLISNLIFQVCIQTEALKQLNVQVEQKLIKIQKKQWDASEQLFAVLMFLWWFTNGRERKLVGTSERVHWLVQPGLRWELTAEWFISLQTSQVIVLCGAWVTGMACYFYQLLLCKGLVELLFSFVNNNHPNVLLTVNTYLMDGWVLEHRPCGYVKALCRVELKLRTWNLLRA